MPRPCSICNHPDRIAIEDAAMSDIPLRNISKQFSVGYVSIQRHAINHLSQSIQEIKQEQVAQSNFQSGSNALSRMSRAESIIDELIEAYWSEDEKKLRVPDITLKALAEMRRQIELRAKLEGELDERSITVTAIPEWQELRALLLEALSVHPQAKVAVMRVMEAYNAQSA
jgi:hypothetical protein